MINQQFKTKIKNFLPSKRFSLITGICIFVLILTFGLMFLLSGEEKFAAKKKGGVKGQTVIDLVGKDSDGDSIPDWEEDLWGTDKNTRITHEGTPDSVYIENKKKELNLSETVDSNTATETDKFAREFFSAYAAMKSEGVDQETINNFSSALGQKIVNTNLLDQYEEKDVKISLDDTEESRAEYYLKIKDIFDKYLESGIGEELDVVSSGLISYGTSGATDIPELLVIGEAYTSFADEIMEVSVPDSLVELHLSIANSASNTGISVTNMTKIINDPIVGLSGISQYQKYSEELVTAVTDLEENL